MITKELRSWELAGCDSTEKRRHPTTGQAYPWIVRSTAMVNHFYFYCVDRDFGPFFLKFCTYFPYSAKLCLKGHEYVKRQLAQRGIAYEALDNGVLACRDPRRLPQLCDGLSAEAIEALLRKWLRRLPHPLTARDQRAGYRYHLSILQQRLFKTGGPPHSARPVLHPATRRKLLDGKPLSSDSPAHRATCVAPHVIESVTPGACAARRGVEPAGVSLKGTVRVTKLRSTGSRAVQAWRE